jgi:hypothetical protein
MKTKYLIMLSCLLAVIFIASSCKEEDENIGIPRLFMPQVTSVDNTVDNELTVNWVISKGVANYKIDLALDSAFLNIVKSDTVENTVSSIKFTELIGATEYFIRIKALNTDTLYHSKDRILSAVTYSIFLDNPIYVLDNSFIAKWTVKGLPVTQVKVRLNSKELGYPIVKEFDVAESEASQGLKTVSGFKGDTQYIIELYSGSLIRGIGYVTTKTSINNSIDLRDIDPALKDLIFNDTIAKVPSGSVIVLKRGETYNLTSTVALSKSISFVSGYAFLPDFATIKITKNLTFLLGSTIGRVAFTDLNITGATNGAFFIVSQLASCNIDTISFEGCHISTFRGGIRLRGSEIVNNVLVNNCLIDSTSDYGFICTRDAVTDIIKNISIKNSTVYRSRRFIQMSQYLANTPQTTIVENCTFYDAPYTGNILIDFPTNTTMQASVTVKNCIFGKAGAPPPAIPTVALKYGTSISFDAGASNYTTNDFYFSGNSTPTTYNDFSTALFADPVHFDFTIKDGGFSGKNTAGDPRWRK